MQELHAEEPPLAWGLHLRSLLLVGAVPIGRLSLREERPSRGVFLHEGGIFWQGFPN